MAQAVTVGCKYPNGIILHLKDKQVVLRGANAANIIGGHGMTEGVDKEFMDEWFKIYADNDIVKGGHVFYADKKSVEAEAREKEEHLTGFEPLDPNKAPGDIEVLASKG